MTIDQLLAELEVQLVARRERKMGDYKVVPVAWVTADTVDGQTVNGKPRRIWWENNEGVGIPIYTAPQPAPNAPTFRLGDHVRKTKGSQWKGRVVGTYSTGLTPEGYAVESDTEKGSVQIYPVGALELVGDTP